MLVSLWRYTIHTTKFRNLDKMYKPCSYPQIKVQNTTGVPKTCFTPLSVSSKLATIFTSSS